MSKLPDKAIPAAKISSADDVFLEDLSRKTFPLFLGAVRPENRTHRLTAPTPMAQRFRPITKATTSPVPPPLDLP
ncbi:MAG: hypothetical protein WKF71_05445 [Pyrinomonadaceae bacterium]